MKNKKHSYSEIILNNLQMVIYIKDLKGNPLDGNIHFQSLMNDTSKQKELYELDNIGYLSDIDTEIIERKKHFIEEKFAKEHWFCIEKSPIFDREGNVENILVSIKDITKEKELEHEKETFIATLVHDLKTPTLAQIKVLSLILDKKFGEITNNQNYIIKQVLNSCKYMYSIISNILSTYKIEHNRNVITPNFYNIEEIINNSCKEINYLCEDKKQQILVDIDIKEKIAFHSELEIKRVIINLISNAIFHAASNSIINISLKEKDKNLTFEVRNVIERNIETDLDKIFNKYQTSQPKSNYCGTGLGLYLSKQIINAHNGEIFAKRNRDKEITFGFYIPRNYEHKNKEISLKN